MMKKVKIIGPEVDEKNKAMIPLTVYWTDKDGGEHEYSVDVGEKVGELGKGILKNAVKAWTGH